MKFGLPRSTIKKIQAVFARYPQVEQVILYGSRAKGTHQTGSDIDLTLVGGENLTIETLYRILEELDDLNLPYSIDLSIYRTIKDVDLIGHIQRVGQIFYQREKESSS